MIVDAPKTIIWAFYWQIGPADGDDTQIITVVQIAAPACSDVLGTSARLWRSLENSVQQGQDGDVMRDHWEGTAGLIGRGGRSQEWAIVQLTSKSTTYWLTRPAHTFQPFYGSQCLTVFIWSVFTHTPHLEPSVTKEKQQFGLPHS